MFRGRGGFRGRFRVRRTAAQTREVRAIFRHERMLEHGQKLQMSADPPRIAIAPWFTMTLMFHTSLGTGTPDVVTVDDTLDMLRVQLGLPASVDNTVWRIRYTKFRVWADATSAVSSAASPLGLLLEPYSLIGEGYQEKIQDWSGEVQYAKCGWVYPRPQTLAVFVAGAVGNANNVARVSVSRGAAIPVIYYIDIMWAANTTIIEMLSDRELEDSVSNLSLKDLDS